MTKTIKKTVALLLVSLTLLSLTAVSAFAYTTDDERFDFKIVDTGKAEIINYDQSSKDVVIPETIKDSKGNSYTVVSIDSDAFGDGFGATVESLSVPGSIRTLKSEQFQNFTALEELTLNDGIEKIGNSAFSNCTSLTEVTLPDSVTTLGAFVFGDCSALETVRISNNVAEIPSTAFDRCTSLQTVYLGLNTETVHETAFRGCTKLKDIYVYDEIKSFPSESVDLEKVTFHCYPDSEFYTFCTESQYGINVETYPVKELLVECDIMAQLYNADAFDGLNKEGLTVSAVYEGAPDRDVTERCTLESDDDFSVPGEKTVTVSYLEKTTTYTARVYGLTGITVTADPEKQKYAGAEDVELSKDGLVVTAECLYADDVDVTEECTLSTEDDFTTPGEKTVTVSYKGFTATYTAVVYDFSFTNKPSAITMNYKDAYRFTFTEELPEDVKVVFKSSNPKVLTIDENGNVKTVKRGTSTVTATIEGTDTVVSCVVTVKYTWWQWILIIVLFGWIWYR